MVTFIRISSDPGSGTFSSWTSMAVLFGIVIAARACNGSPVLRRLGVQLFRFSTLTAAQDPGRDGIALNLQRAAGNHPAAGAPEDIRKGRVLGVPKGPVDLQGLVGDPESGLVREAFCNRGLRRIDAPLIDAAGRAVEQQSSSVQLH